MQLLDKKTCHSIGRFSFFYTNTMHGDKIEKNVFGGDRMNNPYSIQIEWNEVYECIVSLYAFIDEKEQKHFQLGPEWKKQTMETLPPAFASELSDERWEVLHRLVLLAAQVPDQKTVPAFLNWLGQLPAGEIYERLAPWVTTIPLDLTAVRDHCLSVLERWNQHYFSKLEPVILKRLAESADQMRQQAERMEAVELIDLATGGIWIDAVPGLQQIVLVPQYHCAPASVLDFYRGMATCLYPVAQAAQEQDDPLLEILPITQCLADAKRLQILRCLAGGRRTLGELQQQVGLAKSTVHHHVTALRRAGLIRAHYIGSQNVSCYSLRESFVDRLPLVLRAYLESGEHTE